NASMCFTKTSSRGRQKGKAGIQIFGWEDGEDEMDTRMRAKIAAVGLVVLMGGLFAAVYGAGKNRSCTRPIFAMDTFMTFTAYGRRCEDAVDAALLEVQRLDALWSTGDESSEVSRINGTGKGELSKDTEKLLKRAKEIYQETGGLFDFTIYPLMRLWGFPTQEYRVPSKAELQEVLSLVDASKVQQNGREIILGDGQEIDFGGIAKGYTSARVMEIFQEYQIESGMISLGGNVQVLGKKPDGNRWQVGIQDPNGQTGEVLAVLEAEDCAVVTSGGYERYFEEDGNTYIHILDPRTGYPADQDLASVTIVSEDGTLADALSTSLYLMGSRNAEKYWQTHQNAFDMVLITEEGTIQVTEGICKDFHSEEPYEILTGYGQ
ncbi:MAG: FAD:protein FMN transferase, partial [Lachnospiraceae bacterium]|nr:FAD:protein FMN transferase [Lachnospiraceae bacterium]